METRERWRIDPYRSELRFRIGHTVLGELRGQFHCWGGVLWREGDDPRRSAVHVWVDLSSIDTGSARRDQHILATELFDLAAEPALVFDSDRIDLLGPDAGVVSGLLSLNCLRQRVAIAVEQSELRRDSGGQVHPVHVARGSLVRSAFGLRRNSRARDFLGEGVLGDTIEFEASFEVIRENPAAAPNLVGGSRTLPRRLPAGAAVT